MPADYIGVREELARCRELGAPFPVAWSRGLEQLPPLSGGTPDARDRRLARAVLLETQEAWQAAYELREAAQGTESVIWMRGR